jgi:glucose/arabinose dehydrogenase
MSRRLHERPRAADDDDRSVFAANRTGRRAALGEIYAYGMRNPLRYAWDALTGRLFFADIGQNAVEKSGGEDQRPHARCEPRVSC